MGHLTLKINGANVGSLPSHAFFNYKVDYKKGVILCYTFNK